MNDLESVTVESGSAEELHSCIWKCESQSTTFPKISTKILIKMNELYIDLCYTIFCRS